MPTSESRLQTALAYANLHTSDFIEDLKALLRIPSISTLPAYREAVWQAAHCIRDQLAAVGLDRARLIETTGYPLVAAEWLGAPGKPTVLFYGHYDVQPPDGDEPWHQDDPFTPIVRGDDIYARGASDDKGQLLALLKALESLHQVSNDWPVNVRVLIEGEEESGGAGIAAYIRGHTGEIQCDVALIADTSMPAPGVPALVYGLRGILYTEIRARGASHDLHSGEFGGIAPNPLHALACILAGLKGPDGHISIPGLYEHLTSVSDEEVSLWHNASLNIPGLLQSEMGLSTLPGEQGIDPYERVWARPTLEVHGIAGGFTGEGAKTVIPAEATAKVSLRLPPELQLQPAEVFALLHDRITQLCPEGISVDVVEIHSGQGVLVPRDNRFMRVAMRAVEQEWGKPPLLVRTGASIPVGELFQHSLHVPIVFMGTGLPDDNIHAPNEKYHLPNFMRLVRQTIRFLVYLGDDAHAHGIQEQERGGR